MAEFDLEAAAGAVVKRARELCQRHRVGAVSGCCRECVLDAVDEVLAEREPDLKPAGIFDLVQQWLTLEEVDLH